MADFDYIAISPQGRERRGSIAAANVEEARAALGAKKLYVVKVAPGDGAGPEAVAKWMEARGEEIERVRLAVHEIATSGLTLSKLSVAASMLGDLARR